MTQSMTGYSRQARQTPSGTVIVEVRSINHRYLEIDQRLPDGLAGFEGEIGLMVRRHIRRGRVDVTVSIQTPRGHARRAFFDTELVDSYHKALQELTTRYGLQDPLRLDHLLSHPKIFNVRDDDEARRQWWAPIKQTLEAALQALIVMRRQEGARLVKDIRSQVDAIIKSLRAIRKQLPKGSAQQKQRLTERLKELAGASGTLTSAHIHQALLLIKDVDVNEELVRLESHLTHLQQTLKSPNSVGKKLDFISQELMREANTLGAKANDGAIVRHCIEIKGAIEKIREQAQNLE
jgi:uncharacterized protein (TIGR00255 family)